VSTDNPGGAPPRPPRLGESGAPVTTVTLLVLAAVAVIIGFVILRSVSRTSEPGTSSDTQLEAGDSSPSTLDTSPPSTASSTTSSSSTTSTTTTTTPPARKTDTTIVVANASGVDGSATAMAGDLTADGYLVAPVANAPGQRIERSIIYYLDSDPAASGVAALLAAQIPTAQTLPMPARPPLDRPLGDATVALLLGRDAAGPPLAELITG